MKSFKKIVSCFLFIAILTSFLCVTPASAAEGVAGTVQNFTEWSVRLSENVANGFWRIIYGDSWRDDELPDPEEATAKYDEFVNNLQSDYGYFEIKNDGIIFYLTPQKPVDWTKDYYSISGPYFHIGPWTSGGTANYLYFDDLVAPVTGTYSIYVDLEYTYTNYGISFATRSINQGSKITAPSLTLSKPNDGALYEAAGYVGLFCKPAESSFVASTFDVSSRPSSIIGDYGIMGDDGTIVKVEGNTIVNETDKSVYNPITTTQTKYTDCVFDYTDRSYTLTLEDGSTMKVVYGDENVTIHEGDTIYNVYYLSSDSGSEDGSGGSGGSGDTGDDGSGGIGGAIGGLFDVLGEIIYSLIEGLINLATKALSALTGLLDLLKQFAESIIGFFGGYTDFLAAAFPFLPEETFTILNLGLILMIAAAVFKKFL